MKVKTIITFAAVHLFCFTAFSQNQESNELKNDSSSINVIRFAEHHLQVLEKSVQLTENQRVELLNAYKKLYYDRLRAEKNSSSLREEVKSKQESYKIFEATRDRIFTDEQRIQFMQKMEEYKQNLLNNQTNN